MDKVINITTFKERVGNSENSDLNEFLNQAHDLIKKKKTSQSDMVKISQKELEKEFERTILEELIKNKMIDPSLFRCSLYISKLLADTVTKIPKSWFVTDYLETGINESNLKKAANMCFLINSIFPGRGNVKCMKLKDYENMGRSMYYMFYSLSGKNIGFEMSEQFKIMVNITIKSFDNI